MKLPVLVLCTVLAGAAVQDRSKKLGPADLPKVLASASKALDAKRYGQCQRDLKTALGLVGALVRQQLLGVMPAAPSGFTAVEDKQEDEGANAFAAALGVTAVPVEKRYRNDSGDEIKISVLADSPMVGMMGMMFNAAAMSKEGEVITYKENKGLLKKEGDGYNLQVVVSAKHLVTVDAHGIDDDGLLKMIDQAFVDRVVSALDG
ncbi:MAG: hypothetical protein R3F56_02140 [Planctomycetota bacterium]